MAKETEMAQANQEAGKPINDVEIGQEGKARISPTQDENSTVIGASAVAGSAVARVPAKGDLDRRWRRKNDITTSHGLAREHARLIAAMHSGRISLDKGDTLSRAYGRQRDILATSELRESIEALAQQLADTRREHSVVSDIFPKDSKR